MIRHYLFTTTALLLLAASVSASPAATPAAPVYEITPAGIVADAVGGEKASLTQGSPMLADPTAHFTPANAGKSIVIKGAGISISGMSNCSIRTRVSESQAREIPKGC